MNKLVLYPDLIVSIASVTIEAIGKDEKLLRQLQNAYRIETGQNACCFETVLIPFYKKITTYYKSINPNYQKPVTMSKDQSFSLKPKMKFMIPFQGAMQQVNAENVTDETAIVILATRGPGVVNCFSKLPEDYEKQVADYKKKNSLPSNDDASDAEKEAAKAAKEAEVAAAKEKAKAEKEAAKAAAAAEKAAKAGKK